MEVFVTEESEVIRFKVFLSFVLMWDCFFFSALYEQIHYLYNVYIKV
jgi:hypothetical protein